MASCGVIYIPSFMKIAGGLQAILEAVMSVLLVRGIYELRR
jgi:hypothetical protein